LIPSRWPRPTWRGIGFVVSAGVLAVLAWRLGVPVLLSAAGLLASTVALAAAAVTCARPGWTADYSVTPPVVEPDAPVTVDLELRPSRRSVVDALDWSDGRGRGGRLAGQASYELRLVERGRHPIGSVSVRVVDPFGLVSRRTELAGGSSVIVLPRRTPLQGDPPAVVGRAHHDLAVSRSRADGSGEPDVLTRPYQPGDAVKQVHWKATAHRGELTVRQEENPARRRWRVAVDVGTTGEALEWRIRAAASAVRHLAENDVDVRLQLADESFDVQRTDQRAMIALALVDGESTTPLLVDGDDPLIVFAGRLDDDQARRWLHGRSRPAVVFADALSSASSLEMLAVQGWAVRRYRDDDDVAAVWRGEASRESV